MIKSVHDDIHCGVAVTQKQIKLEAWWLGYSRDVKEYIKKCKKLKFFTQNTLHSWPKEVEPWSRVHMDHAYITGVGLQVGQNKFENSDDDQIMQANDLDYSQCGTDLDLPEKEIRERDKERKVIPKMKQSLEVVQDLQRA